MQVKSQKNFSKVAARSKVIIVFILIGLTIGFWAIVFRRGFNWQFIDFDDDARNTPLSLLSEMQWVEGPYKIYYKNQKGLYSIMTDGSARQLLYPKDFSSFLLLDSTRQILVVEREKVVLLDEYGKELRQVFEVSKDKWITLKISPDEKQIMLHVSPDIDVEDVLEEVYLVNLETGIEKRLSQGESGDYTYIVRSNSWSEDSSYAYIETRFKNDEELWAQYFAYNIAENSAEKIGKELLYKDAAYKQKGIDGFVSTSPPVLTRIDNVSRRYYYSRLSEDGSKSIEIDNQGNIKVNDQVIAFSLTNTTKGPEPCSHPGWFPDNNHLIVNCFDLRILESDTGKMAQLAKPGWKAQWFGQRYDAILSNQEN